MRRKIRVGLVESVQHFSVKETFDSKCAVNCGTGVSFGDNEPVSAVPFRVLGVNFHLVKVKNSHNVGNGKRAADMPYADRSDRFHGLFSYLVGFEF